MRPATFLSGAALLAGALVPIAAHAEPGDSETESGVAAAQVVAMGSVHRLADLRFGAFPSPTAAATMTVNPDGSVAATGQLATTMNLFTTADGRGPGRFRIQGTNNRAFVAFLPSRVTITSGTNSMLVDRMRSNVFGNVRLDLDGKFIYTVGGRLNVPANQAPGSYRGEYTLTVLFL
ncbi:DUF4402 domain-containing protein [Aurantiacibacter luteus]|uniref:DUF4402 domain-containing protein n=1 Tax=Aurantiacibacter luteus TaxID=1581420 RepID=A0A0G9MU07_9SPHN|nr:DUF4402 domain-containing protein [Aurantiacibacter luteus]KLE34156.1 hypothetical protein AAW00_07720 [Aurantiacibacter luteus]